MAFRRKVTKGTPKPFKGHFGNSPEFTLVDDSKGAKPDKKPALTSKKRRPKVVGRS
jgi:hypothetical protein